VTTLFPSFESAFPFGLLLILFLMAGKKEKKRGERLNNQFELKLKKKINK